MMGQDWSAWADDGDTTLLCHLEADGLLLSQLAALVGLSQDPTFHPEGCAWTHTLHVVEAMRLVCRRDGLSGERRRVMLFAALCHDMGKATTTVLVEKGGVRRWASPGHDVAGVAPARSFLGVAGVDAAVTAAVLPLVRYHMTHCRRDGWSDKSVKKLARNLAPATVADLLLVMEADCSGRPPLPGGLPPNVNGLVEAATRLGVMDRPGV